MPVMLSEKAESTISKHNMLEKGDVVYAALSGGADSVCLLLVLNEFSERYKITVKAVHVNHHLRGEESDRDEKFCADLCKRLDIPLEIRHVDVKTLAAEKGLSCEEAARELRYKAFNELHCDKITTAHNLNDNAETVLFNLARGTGLKGLTGIPPVRDNIIRPLLSCTREEIEVYLKEHNQDYVTDSTNLSDDFSRNKIRHTIIPLMKELNAGFLSNIDTMTQILFNENKYIDNVSSKFINKPLDKCDEVIRRRCIISALKEHNMQVSSDRIMLINKALLSGGSVNLSGDVFAVCTNGCLEIRTINKKQEYEFSAPLHEGENRFVCDRKVIIDIKCCDIGVFENIVNKKLTNYRLDYDKIHGDIVLRNRRAGDRIQLSGRPFHSSLKKLMNASVPSEMRWKQAVLCDDMGIIWVEGFGADERVKADLSAKKIITVKVLDNE